MTEDFYCDEVLSGKTSVEKVFETPNVLAYHHTRPFYPVHIVVIPKRHISSLITLEADDNDILLELLSVVKRVATEITKRTRSLQGLNQSRKVSGFQASPLACCVCRTSTMIVRQALVSLLAAKNKILK